MTYDDAPFSPTDYDEDWEPTDIDYEEPYDDDRWHTTFCNLTTFTTKR